MSMTYVAMQNAVLSGAFAESLRADAKNWLQARHAWLWDLEAWTFRYGTSTVAFTASSQTVGSVPADFHAVIALYTAQGDPVRGIQDPRLFFDSYNANIAQGAGTPEAFTVVGSTLMVGPKGDGSSGLLIYEKSKPTLSADSDTTGLPDGYDLALIHGAKAEGFKLNNIPLWQGFDEDFTAHANALRRNYLKAVRTPGQQWGAYTPGQWS